jgi:hypothetical protein
MEENKTLVPRKVIESEGQIHYSESFQAWNTIKIKKDLLLEFPQLKEKRAKFSYKLAYCRDIKEIEQEINSKKGGTLFILRILKEN